MTKSNDNESTSGHPPNSANRPVRVGVILGDLGKLNTTALKYLIVHLNTLQGSIEFELLSPQADDPLLTALAPRRVVDREQCRKMLPDFRDRVLKHLASEQADYDLSDRSVPQGLVVISLARLSDDYYGLKSGKVQVQALGEWDRRMAPPSIFEFIITLLMRQSASFAAPTVSKSVHLGTKGCLFDFTADLGEARYKALQSYICSVCRERLKAVGAINLADDLTRVLDTRWLGTSADPACPAGIVANLGYDLFRTKGIKPTLWESIRALLRDEVTKAFINLIAAVLLAALLIWLGLKPR
jgi:hypothetical protein